MAMPVSIVPAKSTVNPDNGRMNRQAASPVTCVQKKYSFEAHSAGNYGCQRRYNHESDERQCRQAAFCSMAEF